MKARSAIVVLAGCLLLAGCANKDAEPSASPTRVEGQITVLAAASLKEAFTALGTQFEQAHPGTKVQLSFGPSSGLATQITEGAPADVFASASPKNMADVSAAKLTGTVRTFATNTLQIAVPAKNPARITRLSDLARPGVTVAVCQAAVPCGVVATKVLSNAGLKITPVSQEPDVKAVLTKVTLDEVDAGLVYVTDVRAAGSKVQGIAIDAAVNTSTSYPIATLTSSKNKVTAQAFADLVLSPTGVAALTAAGFGPAK